MKADIQSLEVFNRLAANGASRAATSLSQLTNIDTHVATTNISFMSIDDVREELNDADHIAVQIGFDGGLAGQSVLVFERDSAATIVDVLLSDADLGEEASSKAVSGVKEVGNIMMGGFIDGWADYLGATIQISVPRFVDGRHSDLIPPSAVAADQEYAFVFKNQMQAVDDGLNFFIYLLPDSSNLTEMLSTRSTDEENAVPIDKLSVFNSMTQHGAHKAAEYISSMTGIETDVEISRIRFVPIEDAPRQIDDGERIGTVFQFDGFPSGYLTILFDAPSAGTIVEALVGDRPDGTEYDSTQQSAIKEIGNIMTSGFLDGWANVLETKIQHTPPQFVNDMGSSILSPIAGRLGRHQEFAFVIDSTVTTPNDEVNCDIFALPNEAELREALAVLEPDRIDKMEADTNAIF